VKKVRIFAGFTTLDLRGPGDAHHHAEREAHVLAFDAADPETGEVVAEAGKVLSDALRNRLLKAGVHTVEVLLPSGRSESPLIKKTLEKDPTKSEARPAADLLAAPARRRPQPGDARQQLQRLFFNPSATTWAGGPAQINHRLKLKTDPNHTVLTRRISSRSSATDQPPRRRGHTTTSTTSQPADPLGRRSDRHQFSVGLSRMARAGQERMSINAPGEDRARRPWSTRRVGGDPGFFGSSQLSQFMDQTNRWPS